MHDIISYPATDGLRSVLAERARQDAKWGIQNHHPRDYFLILTEEVGELAEAIAEDTVFNDRGTKRVREEAVQVAAVALAMVEAIDRREKKSHESAPERVALAVGGNRRDSEVERTMSEHDRLDEKATPRPWLPKGKKAIDAAHTFSGEPASHHHIVSCLAPSPGRSEWDDEAVANRDFIVALANAADDIKRLWEDTAPRVGFGVAWYCPACDGWTTSGDANDIIHAMYCPHEALRWLFGEGADRE